MNNINNNNCNNLQTPALTLTSTDASGSASSSTCSEHPFSLFNKEIPKETRNHIFSFFSQYECAENCVVNKNWNQFFTSLKWPRNLTDYCSELVDEKVLTLGETWQFLPVIQFLEKRAMARINNEYHVKEKNPELANDISANNIIPNCFFKYGNLTFWITNSTDITIEEKGKSESVVLKGEAGKMLVALAVEGNLVFALRKDGLISQWNYQTKKLVNQIKTAYFKRDQRVLRGLGVPSFSGHDTFVLKERFYVPNGFMVQKGFILICYDSWLYTPKGIEIISLTDSSIDIIIEIPNCDWMMDMKISQGKLMIRGSQKALIYALKKKEGKILDLKDKDGEPIDICVGENKVYAINKKLKVYDLKSTKKVKEISFDNVLALVKFSNLILGLSQPQQSMMERVSFQIVILDLNKDKIIGHVDNVIEESSNVFEINKEAFKKLVMLIKNGRQEMEPESTTDRGYFLSRINQIWSFFKAKL